MIRYRNGRMRPDTGSPESFSELYGLVVWGVTMAITIVGIAVIVWAVRGG